VHGENLPASIAISLHGAECGQTYNITATQVSIDCKVPETEESQLNLYIGGYPRSGSALNGAENLRVPISQQQDNIAPVIVLNGTANMDVTLGSAFSDPEATATDNVDGDITANIVVGGDTVDTNTPGTYIITYNVSDSSGNAATEVTRTVIVQETQDIGALINVTPLSAQINALVPFILTGENFPETMTAHIQGADCPSEYKQRISATEYRLQCQHNVAETLYLTIEMEWNGGSIHKRPITFTQQPPITNHPLTDPALARCVNDTLELDQNAIPTEQQLANIANLDCFGEEVVSLQGVESLSSLRHLDLGFNQISDISSLSNLTSLNTLYLYANNITDISSLSNLTSLNTSNSEWE